MKKSLLPGLLAAGLLLVGVGPLAATPMTEKEVTLMLHSGFSSKEIQTEIASRKVLDTLTPDAGKRLVAAGADAALVQVYAVNHLDPVAGAQARADLEARQQASAASQARAVADLANSAASRPAATFSQTTPFLSQLQNDLVVAGDGHFEKYGKSLATNRCLAIYFSASWCGPCRKFTPRLVDFYNQSRSDARFKNFEVIFVSSDQNEQEMLQYMTADHMPWAAMSWNATPATKQLLGRYPGSGIPDLVLIDPTGKVLSDSFRNGQYVGPYDVLDDLGKYLSQAATP